MAAAAGACTWYIRHVDLFSRLSDGDASELSRALTPLRFAAGQMIVGEAEPDGDHIYVTNSGTVRLFQRHADGRELTVARLERGHLFGVTELLSPPLGSRLLAEAETDVEVCVADERHFLDIVARWPKALFDLATRLGVRMHGADDDVRQVSGSGARARLARVLLELAHEASESHAGGGLRLRGVPRHSELAEQIGASRETVTRMLARLEEDGYIRRFGRQIVVPDADRLAEDFEVRTRL